MDSIVQTMTSLEIAELTGKELAHVHRDIRAMLKELKKDDPELDHPREDKDSRGYTTCFHLNRELTDTLLTGYSATARIRVVRRWHELESRPAIDLNNPVVMRSLLLGYTDQVIKLESKVAEQAPKVAALELISASKDTLTFTEASKVLSVKRKDLVVWLHANGWIFRQNASWVAKKTHIDNGCLIYKEASYTDGKSGNECKKPYCHITQKGIVKLAKVFCSTIDGDLFAGL